MFRYEVRDLADADHADDGSRDVTARRRVQQHLVSGVGFTTRNITPFEQRERVFD